MTYGIPTMIACEGASDSASLCRELGFSFVELNGNLPRYQEGRLDAAGLRRIQRESGVYFTLHLDEACNPFDFNPRVAGVYREMVIAALSLAREVGMPLLNLHMPQGVYFTLPDRRVYLFEEYRVDFLAAVRHFREACEAAAGPNGPLICIENTGGFLPFQREAVGLLLESPAFALTWDVGHDHFAGGADEDFLRQNASRIRHMHMHDAAPGWVHLPLGTGELDLRARFAFAREQDCTCVIEVKTPEALRQSAEWMREEGLL